MTMFQLGFSNKDEMFKKSKKELKRLMITDFYSKGYTEIFHFEVKNKICSIHAKLC